MNRFEALNVLGLDEDASQADIKAAYKECVQIMHPDRFANNKKLQNRATEQFKRLQEAYDVLTSGKGSKGPSAKQSSSSGGRYTGSATQIHAKLAGLDAAKANLIAQRDELLDERRNALLMVVGGAVVALLMRRLVWVAGLAGTVLVWGIVSLVSGMGNLKTIDQNIDSLDKQRKKLLAQLHEDGDDYEEDDDED